MKEETRNQRVREFSKFLEKQNAGRERLTDFLAEPEPRTL